MNNDYKVIRVSKELYDLLKEKKGEKSFNRFLEDQYEIFTVTIKQQQRLIKESEVKQIVEDMFMQLLCNAKILREQSFKEYFKKNVDDFRNCLQHGSYD